MRHKLSIKGVEACLCLAERDKESSTELSHHKNARLYWLVFKDDQI